MDMSVLKGEPWASSVITKPDLSRDLKELSTFVERATAFGQTLSDSLTSLSQTLDTNTPTPSSPSATPTTTECGSASGTPHFLNDLEIDALDRLAVMAFMLDLGPWPLPAEFHGGHINLGPNTSSYIAAASPRNIRALIRQLRETYAENERLTRELGDAYNLDTFGV